MKYTTRVSLEELNAKHAAGEIAQPRPHAPTTDMPEGFWDDAEVVMPKTKKAISLRVDPDVLEFFKAQGDGHLTRMHAVLRSYVDAQRKKG